jgi:hypothetical protein
MISVYRREIRGEGIDDELPKGIAAALWRSGLSPH